MTDIERVLQQRQAPTQEHGVILDSTQFIMPRDWELQFPAMATLQAYVAVFKQKMQHNDATFGTKRWDIVYQIDIPDADLDFFKQAGLLLAKDSEPLTEVDMLVDFSDAKLEWFKTCGKHVLQACAMLSGLPVTITPFPRLKNVKPSMSNLWLEVNGNDTPDFDLLKIADNQITGVYGLAGRWTFLAASMGLAVIEILPPGRPKRWLSKYANPLYRVSENGTRAEISRAQSGVDKTLHLMEQMKVQQELERGVK